MKNPCLLKASAEFEYAESIKTKDLTTQLIFSAGMTESIELSSFEGILFISHYDVNIDKPNKLEGFLCINDLKPNSFKWVVIYFKLFLSVRYRSRESANIFKLISTN
jgi:hypothetical protein